ncbi:MAG: radical SAM protein, partial [Candidatus Omnitrophota bacterium]
MYNKKLNRTNVKKEIGWVYDDLKWLTGKELKSANNERDALLKSLSKEASFSFMQSKIHIGELSPGCLMCATGHWSCLYINGLCTANCFYCRQDRKIREERLPKEEIYFDNPEYYIAYAEKLNFKGIGFSGGETLLVFDKLLRYIEKIRERFGKSMYLWIYTNGNLATKDKLKRLKKSGLDEIRFNISANDYDLRPAELAVGIMNTVTVEIPSIPEDYEI